MSQTEARPSVPSGWAWTTLGEVVDSVPLTGLKLPQGQYEASGSLPVVDQGQELVGGHTNREDLRIRVERPVIVFGDHTKAIKYVDFDFVAGADGIKPLVPWEVFFPKLFYYLLLALRLPDKGYARHFQFLVKSSMPILPFHEQRRIVAKIEELFSQLDAGIEELKKAKAQLKRYRQSVLKAAFEGKLTEEWRRQRANRQQPGANSQELLETAKELLERIKAERKKALGPKYKDPPPLDTSKLPELPEGWVWVSLELLADISSGTTPSRGNPAYWLRGKIPWIMSAAVNEPYVDVASEYVTGLALAETSLRVYPSGTLILAMYGEGRTRGKVSELRLDATINQALAALVMKGEAAVAQPYVKLFVLQSYDEIRRPSSGGVQPNLTVGLVKRITAPLPPIVEQRQIVAEAEQRLSIVDAEEKASEAALKQAARVRQSILKRAFEGRLVPQDPSDEPADRLLERIRAEKAKHAAGQPRGRGRRTATAGK